MEQCRAVVWSGKKHGEQCENKASHAPLMHEALEVYYREGLEDQRIPLCGVHYRFAVMGRNLMSIATGLTYMEPGDEATYWRMVPDGDDDPS